jgi:hypothetical protein
MTASSIDWTATGTMLPAIVAFASFWVQIWFSRRQLSELRQQAQAALENQRTVSKDEVAVHLNFEFIDRWERASMRHRRSVSALRLLKKDSGTEIDESVVGFFEDLGALQR